MWTTRRGARLLAATLVLGSCSVSLGPTDIEATIEPDLIHLEPAAVSAGETVSVLFPDERSRGVLYVLESRDGDTWNLEYHLFSDGAASVRR